MKGSEDHYSKHKRMLGEERRRNSQLREEIEEARDRQDWEKVRFLEELLAISNKSIDDLIQLVEADIRRKLKDRYEVFLWFG